MQIDTTRTVEIRASATHTALAIFVALAMTAVCVAVAVTYFGTGNSREYMGWAGAILFGALTTATIWRSSQIGGGQAVLTLSSRGFRDIRISQEFIPWTAVGTISVRESHMGKGAVVKSIAVEVPDDVRKDARFGRSGDWSQRVGADGLSISVQELSPPFNDVLEMMRAYAASHGGKAE
jgi:hypothetical protein